MSADVELLFRGFVLEPSTDREALVGDIQRALDRVNAQLGSTFAHDGSERAADVVFTVWVDDPEGSTVSSWIRLTDDEARGALLLEINATTEALLDATSAALAACAPIVQRTDRAPRPF